jgi:hypothetical protein
MAIQLAGPALASPRVTSGIPKEAFIISAAAHDRRSAPFRYQIDALNCIAARCRCRRDRSEDPSLFYRSIPFRVERPRFAQISDATFSSPIRRASVRTSRFWSSRSWNNSGIAADFSCWTSSASGSIGAPVAFGSA